MVDEYQALDEELAQKRSVLCRKTIEILQSIRKPTPLGGKELKQQLISNPGCAHVKPVVEALADYPKEMVNGLIKNVGKFTIDAKKKRGYWNLNSRRMAVRNNKQVAYHEIGHAMESACPIILYLEAEFYNKRTAGCKLEKLNDIVQNGTYDADEVARKDSFVTPYIGKDYNGTAYELVSMGFEMYFSKPDELMKDKDFFRFVAGILCTVAP